MAGTRSNTLRRFTLPSPSVPSARLSLEAKLLSDGPIGPFCSLFWLPDSVAPLVCGQTPLGARRAGAVTVVGGTRMRSQIATRYFISMTASHLQSVKPIWSALKTHFGLFDSAWMSFGNRNAAHPPTPSPDPQKDKDTSTWDCRLLLTCQHVRRLRGPNRRRREDFRGDDRVLSICLLRAVVQYFANRLHLFRRWT